MAKKSSNQQSIADQLAAANVQEDQQNAVQADPATTETTTDTSEGNEPTTTEENTEGSGTEDTGNPHADQANDTRLADGVKFIRELGRDSAAGKDSLPKLAFQITKMAAEGVIDLDKKYEGDDLPKGGKYKYDDAEFLFNEYSKAEGKKAVHERSAGGLKANISKVRQFVQFGMLPNVDPQDVLERAAKVRKQMILDTKKVKSAYAAYIDVARTQIKGADDALTDDQLADVIAKPEKASPELRKIIDGMFKKLEKLYTDGIDGVQDMSDHIKTAADALRDRLAEIDAANAPEPTDEEAAQTLAQLGKSDRLAEMLAKLGYAKV